MQYVRTSDGTSEQELLDAYYFIKQFPSETTVQLLEFYRSMGDFEEKGTISEHWTSLDGCDGLYVFYGYSQAGDPKLTAALHIDGDTLTLLAARTDHSSESVSDAFHAEMVSRCENGERYG